MAAPVRLRPVEDDGATQHGYGQYVQRVDEAVTINGHTLVAGDEWTGGVLYLDHLGIGFTERVADVPQFAQQVEALSGQPVTVIRGVASVALPGDPPLLGDWIASGTFDPPRLARRFDQELGGTWTVTYRVKNPRAITTNYEVEIARTPGT